MNKTTKAYLLEEFEVNDTLVKELFFLSFGCLVAGTWPIIFTPDLEEFWNRWYTGVKEITVTTSLQENKDKIRWIIITFVAFPLQSWIWSLHEVWWTVAAQSERRKKQCWRDKFEKKE